MLQLLCSHLTPDNCTLRLIGPALNLYKQCGRRVGTLLTWIDFCRKHMRQILYLMSHLGYITLLKNICRPRGGFKRMWRRPPSNSPIPPSGTSLCGHLRERHQPGPCSSARWECQGVVLWLLWWTPSWAKGCLYRQEPKGYSSAGWPAHWSPHTVVSGLKEGCWDQGLDISTPGAVFPSLWLFESITRQGSERICEPAAWFVTKKVSLILIALSSSTDLKNPGKWQNKRRQKQDGTEGLLTRDAD